MKKFTIYLLKYSEGMSKDEIAESLLKEANNVTRKKDDKPKRMKGVPLAVYVTLFRSVGYTPYILLSTLSCYCSLAANCDGRNQNILGLVAGNHPESAMADR